MLGVVHFVHFIVRLRGLLKSLKFLFVFGSEPLQLIVFYPNPKTKYIRKWNILNTVIAKLVFHFEPKNHTSPRGFPRISPKRTLLELGSFPADVALLSITVAATFLLQFSPPIEPAARSYVWLMAIKLSTFILYCTRNPPSLLMCRLSLKAFFPPHRLNRCKILTSREEVSRRRRKEIEHIYVDFLAHKI